MSIIEKKIWAEAFDEDKLLNVDFRLADFDLAEGDHIRFREWDPTTKEYTGREYVKIVKRATKSQSPTRYWTPEQLEKHGLYLLEWTQETPKKIGVGFGVMLLRDGKILLGKRHDDPEKASSALHGEGTWAMPGGKLHFGETFESGARREVMEETGVTVGKLSVISLSNDIVSDAHFVTVGLLCEDFSGEAQVMEPDEITKWEWFSLDQLPSPLYSCSKEVIENYTARRFYDSL